MQSTETLRRIALGIEFSLVQLNLNEVVCFFCFSHSNLKIEALPKYQKKLRNFIVHWFEL